jgi:hypothetical protein
MNVFLSHISEEASEAQALKKALESAIPGSEVFVSSTDIQLGDLWLNEIEKALKSSKVILVLCSPGSILRPWLNFECGSGRAKQLPVIPVCHKGMDVNQLPDPLHSLYEAIDLTNTDSCRILVEQLAKILKLQIIATFESTKMFQSLKAELPARSAEIGIVLSHRQDEWVESEFSVFNLFNRLPYGLSGEWFFSNLKDKKVFLSQDLNRISGLIFASPFRAKLEPETIRATIEWVRKGGRLLLLGFELGDRHHGANLAELSHHFGIDPSIDIVGPKKFGKNKPYEVPLNFNISNADPHPFTDSLMTVQLTNVQTLRVEPGGIEWLRVGENIVYQPERESVQYHDGTMTAPAGPVFVRNRKAGWLPVAVEAPKGLCGKGSVNMIGTWDMTGRSKAFGGDNFMLISRLLNWLSRKGG